MELVSAYIPCYNNIDTVAEAINSIKRQTVAVGELFVIDDGSTDGSADAVESMGVRVIRNERNLGRGAVRNRAMTEAKNEFVLCCDATNILTPDFLEKALLWFEDEKVAAVFGRIKYSKPKNVAERWRNRHLFKTGAAFQITRKASLITYGTLVRKSAVLGSGNYNAALRHSEDAELGERLLKNGHDVIFDPDLAVFSIARNNLWQVLERYWRWYTGKDEKISFLGYLKKIWYSIKVMAMQDAKDNDFGSVFISLFLPHYCFWKSKAGQINDK